MKNIARIPKDIFEQRIYLLAICSLSTKKCKILLSRKAMNGKWLDCSIWILMGIEFLTRMTDVDDKEA